MNAVREIVAAVQSSARSAREVVEDSLRRIESADSDIRAFLDVHADRALEVADAVDVRVRAGEQLPLAGVPIAVKDNMATRGHPTTCGSAILDRWCPPYDATVITRLAAAGAVLVGKTNMDEFAMGSSTENSAFGTTLNPVRRDRVPGGSSGGSAAAVAAEMVPAALGSDTGGSIRQPASFCGVVGVKPTYGRVSRYGLVAYASSLDQIGPFASSVGDAALVYHAISGHDPMDTTSLASEPHRIIPRPEVAGLRIGVVRELLGEGIAPAVAHAVRATADALQAAGASVEEISIPSLGHALSAYYLIATAEASSNLARFDGVRFGLRVEAPTTPEMYVATRTQGFGEEVQRRIMLGTYALSAGYYDEYYGTAQKVRTLVIRDFAAAYAKVDVLLSPTAPTTAFRFGEHTADPLTMYLQDVCTIPTNLAGHPAMSVPTSVDDDGMPIGVQVLAPALGEEVMFNVGAAIEEAYRG